jgi:choloylglycine hydrolase
MRRVFTHLVLLILLGFICNPSFSCTDFRLIAKDGTILITRSMEFAEDLKSNIRSAPRGKNFNNTAPDGKPAMSWKSKYGYVYADGLEVAMAADGLNEKGLSFEFLYLPGETKYQTVPAEKNDQAIPYFHFGDWILGNFATLEEVRSALATVYIYEQKIANLGNIILPLHAAIYDATGKGIVVEFVDGKMNIYDNKVGTLTNSPTYEWHLVNLRNYINLSPYNPKPVSLNSLTFIATGQGSGMIGLPGDTSPPSRFIKTSVLCATVTPANDALEVLNLGQHIINTVDIPRGFVRAKQNGTDLVETTQWVVFKDLTHKKLYYRTYDNLTIRSIALENINFSENAPELIMPMKGGTAVLDVSQDFTAAKK